MGRLINAERKVEKDYLYNHCSESFTHRQNLWLTWCTTKKKKQSIEILTVPASVNQTAVWKALRPRSLRMDWLCLTSLHSFLACMLWSTLITRIIKKSFSRALTATTCLKFATWTKFHENSSIRFWLMFRFWTGSRIWIWFANRSWLMPLVAKDVTDLFSWSVELQPLWNTALQLRAEP